MITPTMTPMMMPTEPLFSTAAGGGGEGGGGGARGGGKGGEGGGGEGGGKGDGGGGEGEGGGGEGGGGEGGEGRDGEGGGAFTDTYSQQWLHVYWVHSSHMPSAKSLQQLLGGEGGGGGLGKRAA